MLCGEEILKVLKEVHPRELASINVVLRSITIASFLLSPTINVDPVSFAPPCSGGQLNGNQFQLQLSNYISYLPLAIPHLGFFDLITPINLASRGHIWILIATEGFVKWVEAVPLKKESDAAEAYVIRENIICWFGIPKHILSDEDTFVNDLFKNNLGD